MITPENEAAIFMIACTLGMRWPRVGFGWLLALGVAHVAFVMVRP